MISHQMSNETVQFDDNSFFPTFLELSFYIAQYVYLVCFE